MVGLGRGWLYEEVDSEFRSGKFRNWLPLASRQAHCIPHATVEKMHSLSARSERSVLSPLLSRKKMAPYFETVKVRLETERRDES